MSLWGRIGAAAVGAALVSSLVGSVARAEGAANFGIRPVRYDPTMPVTQSYFVFDARPGQTIHSEAMVLNNGTAPGTVRLYAVDATTGPTGGAAYLTDNYPRQEVGSWLALDQSQLTLAPDEKKVVPFTLTVPSNAPGGQHLGGLVAEDTALRSSDDRGNLLVSLRLRAVTAVQVNLPGTAVDNVAVDRVAAGSDAGYPALVVTMRNDGNEMEKPTGNLTVTDADGRQVEDLPFAVDTFLPGTSIAYPLKLTEALADGQYRAFVHFTYGKAAGKTVEKDFTVGTTAAAPVVVTSVPRPEAPDPAVTATAVASVATDAAAPGHTGASASPDTDSPDTTAFPLGAVPIGLLGLLGLGRLGRFALRPRDPRPPTWFE